MVYKVHPTVNFVYFVLTQSLIMEFQVMIFSDFFIETYEYYIFLVSSGSQVYMHAVFL